MNEYCPTLAGIVCGYKAEYKIGKDWKNIPTIEDKDFIPYPHFEGGILSTIGLQGYNQSKAIAHWYAATIEHTKGKIVKVRVQEYEITFDIKAKKIIKFKQPIKITNKGV